MNQTETMLNEQVKAETEYMRELRRHFHMYPELSAKEYETQKKIEEELDRIGLPHRRIAGTGVYTEITGEKDGDRTIVLRADIDALPVSEENITPYMSRNPGVMHACGHDAHTAALLGALKVLSRNRNLFGGKVIATFQPGEEIGYGARIIVDDGIIDEADRTFGIHLASEIETGTVCVMPGPNKASVDWFRISVHGKSSHVADPDQGADAAYIAAQIVVAAQALVTRRVNPMENVLIGIGRIDAGTAYNIVAQDAVIEGTLRAMKPQIRAQVKNQLNELAAQIASVYGGRAETEWKDYTSPLINDPQASAEVQKTVVSLFGEEHLIRSRTASLMGDDMAEYILRVPGAYAYVGSGNDDRPETRAAHHNSHFDIDERCLNIAALLHVCYTVEYLNHETD